MRPPPLWTPLDRVWPPELIPISLLQTQAFFTRRTMKEGERTPLTKDAFPIELIAASPPAWSCCLVRFCLAWKQCCCQPHRVFDTRSCGIVLSLVIGCMSQVDSLRSGGSRTVTASDSRGDLEVKDEQFGHRWPHNLCPKVKENPGTR